MGDGGREGREGGGREEREGGEGETECVDLYV